VARSQEVVGIAAIGPVVIEAAINGLRRKADNPNVPISPDEIAVDALACFEAGATVVHNHIDRYGVSDEEAAARYLEAWEQIWAVRPDALVYPTVNPTLDGEIGYDHLGLLAETGRLRMGLADPGSVNLGGTLDGVPVGDFVYRNSFDTLAHALDVCRRHRLGPSLAIYEPGFLRATLAWWRADRLPPGSMIKLYFSTDDGLTGAPFGLPPTRPSLDAYLAMLDGCPVPWAVSLAGGDVVASEVAAPALARGAHLHVGLEFFGGERQPTNAELVAEAVELCGREGRPVATPEQAIEILGLPGRA
jgi:3-keto-5-aminohexanoate cleavage enzyme